MKTTLFLLLLVPMVTCAQETDPKDQPLLLKTDTIFSDDLIIEIFAMPEKEAEYVGGESAMQSFLGQNMHHPYKLVVETGDVGGKVWVKAIVDVDGSLEDAKVKLGLNEAYDAEALRLVNLMPAWKPAEREGKAIRSQVDIPLVFEGGAKEVEVPKEEIVELPFVEEMPEFPGGQMEMQKFLMMNIKYPDEARDNGVEGRVFVKFTVGSDGAVKDAKVLRGVGSGCDEEALRVVSSMPNWKPATQQGKPVPTTFNVPIRFMLH